jgi:hypothetical protein
MKIKGTPGTAKIGDIELMPVESLEMKTPGFTEPIPEWDGTITGNLGVGSGAKIGDIYKFRFDDKEGEGVVETINKDTGVVILRASGPVREVKI